MRFAPLTRSALVLLALFAAACTDERAPITTPPTEQPPVDPPKTIGLFHLTINGIGTDDMSAEMKAVGEPKPSGISPSMTAVDPTQLVLETVSTSSFTEGSRTGGGQRYLVITFRVRNATAGPLNNLTYVLAGTASTFAGTPVNLVRRFDGTNSPAGATIAQNVIPTGMTGMGSDLVSMVSSYPDVLQVFTEAEVAAIASKPANVTNVFPAGYVVRSKNSTANRTLPSAAADPNQFDGLLTVGVRVPLQATVQEDVFIMGIFLMAVTDTETRMTESIEEAQDTGAVRRLRERATALGATTVTVLNGSSVMDPAVADYPGQRQICSPRTAGTSGAATNTIVSPAAYSTVKILTPGETIDPAKCAAYFRTGVATRPATNVPFTVTVKAMDRYGNIKTAQADTFRLVETNGVPATVGASVALASGTADLPVTYTNYGNAILMAQGRRLRGYQPIPVAGVVRTWTAGASNTNWFNNGNWSPAAAPMALDSVLIPAAAPIDPVLVANATVRGVTVEDGATISLGAFDLTANANVSTGTSGGITNTTGRLFLSGTAMTVQGVVPTLRVNGTYSITEAGGNVTARAPITIEAGRLTVSGRRLQASSQ
ncbi:MAG TPA: hypothetical protein VFS20_27620 [Longimicrobium sp.]|nr:hypothetical protein [Longimicrobium sp.]